MPRMGVGIGEGQGHGEQAASEKSLLAHDLCQDWQHPQPLEISHIPSSPSFSFLPPPLPPGPLPGN